MKRIILPGLIVLLSLFAFGVYAQTNSSAVKEENNVSRVERLITEKTPTFIKDAMQITAKFLEDFRMNAYKSIQAREQKISKDISMLDQEMNKDPVEVLDEDSTIKANPLSHAFKTVQLFFLKLIAGIFASKLAFYGISLLILIIVLRYTLG